MNKGLEALAKISNDFDEVISIDENGMPNGIGNRLEQNYVNEMAIIRKELQHLEAIDNANPSEALECLEGIEADLIGLSKHVTEYDDGFENYLEDIWYNIDVIKQALLKAQEQEKALEIIEKYITLIHDDSLDESTNFKELWLIMLNNNWNCIDIPQQEFDSLKEVFGSDR